MHVVFVEPHFPVNQREFVRALRQVGARVTGIGESPLSSLDRELERWLYHYEQVKSVCDEPAMLHTVRSIQARERVDRLEATIEAHILPTAHVREACGIPGTSSRTAFLCRDKPAMKEVLRAAGVPCARSIAASSPDEVRRFVAEVGYPVILKPRDAAGAAGTTRTDDERQLAKAIARIEFDRGLTVAVEEFVEGHEGFYDTISIGGQPRLEFVSHYYPNVLEAMRERWISPQFISTNRVEQAAGYQQLREMGKKVIKILGVETSATHMEWFYGGKGLKFSEIGCRPPGVRAWDLYAAGNDIDIYQAWAESIVHGGQSLKPSRRLAAGIVALRPDRDGRISGYEGVEAALGGNEEWLIDTCLPEPGTLTQPVEAGYMANAWVRLRHPDYDELRSRLDHIGRTLKVRTS